MPTITNATLPSAAKNSSKILNPIQQKKTTRPQSTKITIDCDGSSSRPQNMQANYKQVFDFLKDINLENYTEQFVQNGINSQDKMMYVTNDALKLIKVPYAHRMRLLKKVKEIQTLQQIKKTISNKGNLSKVKLKKDGNDNKYEELILPKEEDDIEVEYEEQRKTFTQAIYDYQKTHNKDLYKGNNSKRNINEDAKTIKKTVETSVGPTENEENISDNDDVNIDVGEYTESSNTFNIIQPILLNKDRTSEKYFFPLNSKKTICFQCLHMIIQDKCLVKYNKQFCSLHCIDLFEEKSLKKCSNCNVNIEISKAVPSLYEKKIYYCSEKCLEEAEPNENKVFNVSQVISKDVFKKYSKSTPKSSDSSGSPIDILE